MQSYTPSNHDSSFEINVSHDPIDWLSAAGMMVMATVLIFLNISLIRSIRTFRQENKTDHASKLVLCSIGSTISFTVTSVSCLITTLLMTISGDFYHRTVVGDIGSKTSLSFYTLSQTLMFYAFIRRIDEAFGGSAIQYPQILMKSLYATSILFVIFCLFMTFALAFELLVIFVYAVCIWMALFLCLSMVLCILFVRRANILLKAASETNSVVDKDFLHVVIKQSIVVPFAICTSFSCFMAVSLVQYLSGSSEWIPAAIFWIVIDCTVSSISIFLLFSWNNHIYNKYCSLLHHCCAKNKIAGMELLKIKKGSKSTADRSDLNEVTLTQPAYTISAFSSGSNLIRTTNTVQESTGNLSIPQSKMDTYSGSSDDMTTPTVITVATPNLDIADPKNETVVMSTKPELTFTQSLKRMVGKDGGDEYRLAVNLGTPKLGVVHSAPPRYS